MSEWTGLIGVAAGTLLGWATAEGSARLGFHRDQAAHLKSERRALCIELIKTATTIAHDGREAVVITQYMKQRPDIAVSEEQFNLTSESFNRARDGFRLGVAQLRVLGPPALYIAAQQLVNESDSFFGVVLPIAGATAKSIAPTQMGDVDGARDALLAAVDHFADAVAAELTR